jgi:hypothetical protein
MVTFTQSFHCRSRAHCQACRNDAAFRASLLRAGMVTARDFPCPLGAPISPANGLPRPLGSTTVPVAPSGVPPDGSAQSRRGLGDIVEAAAKPIAKALKLPCLDRAGRLKPRSGCAQRRDTLNDLFPL